MFEFKEFKKIPRLNREVFVTEKLDGTNACVVVSDDGSVAAQSRSRFITPENDNYGFAKWVAAHAEELKQLGPGYHYGEWWGQGIQRNYGLTEKRFSLFNVDRWSAERPACCHVVPVITKAVGFETVNEALSWLGRNGSVAAPGFMKPEGVIAYHTASGQYFKATLERDDEWKGKQNGQS